MSLEIAVANGIVKLADKLGEWAKWRHAGKERRFHEIISPAFTALQDVHRDYLQMFEAAKQQNREGTGLGHIRKSLATRRLVEEARRKGLVSRVQVLTAVDVPQDVRVFFGAVQQYFVYTPLWEGTASATLDHALQEAEDAESKVRSPQLYVRLEEIIDGTLCRMRNSWNDVAAAYARAQLEALK